MNKTNKLILLILSFLIVILIIITIIFHNVKVNSEEKQHTLIAKQSSYANNVVSLNAPTTATPVKIKNTDYASKRCVEYFEKNYFPTASVSKESQDSNESKDHHYSLNDGYSDLDICWTTKDFIDPVTNRKIYIIAMPMTIEQMENEQRDFLFKFKLRLDHNWVPSDKHAVLFDDVQYILDDELGVLKDDYIIYMSDENADYYIYQRIPNFNQIVDLTNIIPIYFTYRSSNPSHIELIPVVSTEIIDEPINSVRSMGSTDSIESADSADNSDEYVALNRQIGLKQNPMRKINVIKFIYLYI